MAFIKLDTGILNSTLWVDREAREIFIAALLLAVPKDCAEPVAEIATDSTDPTGYEVPAGWYGFVPASGPGLVRLAGVPQELGMLALARLSAPDQCSRTAAHDGRRMIRVDGGYLVLNYMKYRDVDHGAAERMRKLRMRAKAARG